MTTPPTLYHGDALDVLPTLPAESIDAVITDPPYGLGFMGKKWDVYNGVAFQAETWKHVFRVLKLGGHLLCFGGTRTYHRITCAIEDAGFEIRDSLHWIYGQGFPKSLDVAKAIDKAYGLQRRVIERKKGIGSNAGTGRYNWNRAEDPVDRRMYDVTEPASQAAKQWQGWGTSLKPSHEPIVLARKPFSSTVAKIVQEHGTGALNIDGCRIPTDEKWTGRALPDAKDGVTWGGALNRQSSGSHDLGRWPPNILLTHSPDCEDSCSEGCPVSALDKQSDSGVSRFFPIFRYQPKASKRERGEGNPHPTVKPLMLMAWLCRLVTPPGGTVLDPFAGSGTTLMAAGHEKFRAIGIELDADYCDLVRRRLASHGIGCVGKSRG